MWIAVDPSISTTGVAVVTDGIIPVVATKTITTRKESDEERIEEILSGLDYVKAHSFPGTANAIVHGVACETHGTYSRTRGAVNIGALMKLSKVVGAVQAWARAGAHRFVAIPALKWMLAGRSTGTKQKSMTQIKAELAMEIQINPRWSEHVIAAICIGRWAIRDDRIPKIGAYK